MKKLFILSCFLLLFSSFSLFADNKAGTNKIGGLVGMPIGLSFSHNFTTVDQIDLTVGVFPGYFLIGHSYYRPHYGIDIALGYLRSVAQPNLGGAVCPFEIGGGISFTGVMLGGYNAHFTAYFDMRWEFFFKETQKFNLFLDFSPGIGFHPYRDNFYVYYAPRGGIGFRAVLN